MAPAIDEPSVAALAPGWNSTTGWDAASPPFQDEQTADRFAPGASLPNALPGDTLDAGAFDFAAPPDPAASGEPSLTKFLAALFALAALARYPWRDVLRETYYPRSY